MVSRPARTALDPLHQACSTVSTKSRVHVHCWLALLNCLYATHKPPFLLHLLHQSPWTQCKSVSMNIILVPWHARSLQRRCNHPACNGTPVNPPAMMNPLDKTPALVDDSTPKMLHWLVRHRYSQQALHTGDADAVGSGVLGMQCRCALQAASTSSLPRNWPTPAGASSVFAASIAHW
jgi:hypothetical protein